TKNSVTYVLNQPPLHFAGGAVFDFTGKGFIGGITIERFRSAGRELRRTEYGTMMRVERPRPPAPGGLVHCGVAWHLSAPPDGTALQRARPDCHEGGSNRARRPAHSGHQDLALHREERARLRLGSLP